MDAMNTVDTESFWAKVRRTVGKVPFAKDVVAMYYAMMDEATPLWAKVAIGGAIVYFVSPVDAIPDALPGLGYADDAAVVAETLVLVQNHVTDGHKLKAANFFSR